MQQFPHFEYIAACVVAFAETILLVGIVTPGSTILLIIGGYAAINGTTNIVSLIACAAIGAIVGDNVNYFLGTKFGARATEKGIWILQPQHLHIGKRYFLQHGGKSVFFGRFIPTMKEIVPFIAGTMHMPYHRFVLFNIAGGTGWAIEFVGLGYVFSGSLLVAHQWLGRIAMFVVCVLLILVFVPIVYTQIKHKTVITATVHIYKDAIQEHIHPHKK